MDMQMPVMDGLVATRRIRSQPSTANLVVIAMTANAGREDQRLCLQAGMNTVLTKPIEPELLFMTLSRWLGGPDAHSPPSAGDAATAPPPALKPAQPDVSALAVWEAGALTRIVGDNPAAHARLLDKYLLTAGEAIAAMQACASGGQWTGVADQGHKLKSSSRSVGAMQLGALCESLEYAGRANKADMCELLVQSVLQSYTQVLERIGGRNSGA
jgi:CheY-like chemotaxis protein